MLTLVDIPPGPAGVPVLTAAVQRVVTEPRTVIAPVPQIGPHVSPELRESLIRCLAVERPIESTSSRSAGGESDLADVQVLLTTSGSTGAPKAVMHTLAALRHSTDALHERLGGAGHWLCALPLHTSAGFMTVARAALAGTESIAAPSLGGASAFTAEAFCSAASTLLAVEGKHYVSLVPQQAERLATSMVALDLLSRFDAVLLGGQAIPDALVATLTAHDIQVVLSYGSTETCGGCVYDGIALRGVSVRIVDGAAVIDGPVVMRGYRDSADGGLNGDGSFTMPDRGELADGRLRILGRNDDIVIVKGVNVSPSHVESMLMNLGVRALVVLDSRTETLVAVVEAATERSTEHSEGAEAVAMVRRHLGLPLRLAKVAAWPMLPSGKPDRRQLAEQLDLTADIT